MKVIDPLKIKIHELLQRGVNNPIDLARMQFGSIPDIKNILLAFLKTQTNTRRHVYIDLTPFERVGHTKELLKGFFYKNSYKIPVLLICSDSLFNEVNQNLDKEHLIIVAKFNERGNFVDIVCKLKINSYIKQQIKQITKELSIKYKEDISNLLTFRNIYSNEILTELLYKSNSIEIPFGFESILNTREENKSIKYISGRFYRIMPNGMLVSCYLNLKHMGRKIEYITEIAYEIILSITDYFRRDIDVLNEFDCIVTPNNTSLFISSIIQAILGKPVIAIDKLGPIPRLSLHRDQLQKLLEYKKVIVIEEIVATASEVDRVLFFLNSIKTTVTKIIALYNLKIGKPMLLQEKQLISLCEPKEELNYVYRSR